MKSLPKVVEESRGASQKGQYLPLSVYKTQGFDWEAIRDGCKDEKPHALFGQVYRVDIEYQSKETMHKRIREELLKSVQERRNKSVEAQDNFVSDGGDAGGRGAGGRGADPLLLVSGILNSLG